MMSSLPKALIGINLYAESTMLSMSRMKFSPLLILATLLGAQACGKSESFKSLEEPKTLLNQLDSKLPLLTHPNSEQKLFTEETLILDFNNEKTGTDEDMTYSCFFDQVIDGSVAEAASCDSLPGGAAQKLDTATGKFVWGPLENTSSYELRFIGKNKLGSDTLILTVEVLQTASPNLIPSTTSALLRSKRSALFPSIKGIRAQRRSPIPVALISLSMKKSATASNARTCPANLPSNSMQPAVL